MKSPKECVELRTAERIWPIHSATLANEIGRVGVTQPV